ncbi:hypothetical protein ABEB36_010451 [Hypothenemus hampei]|uniref:Uncharacterized protein n=1 Tax=Hypothenemus hampei TaxID=57062 RepID=A0ABD1EMQ4_HYPHA
MHLCRRTIILLTLIHMLACYFLEGVESRPQSKNHELLTKLGLQKIRSPNTHHRKRLAVESRQHNRADDSHMFIIKLPPNPHYYAMNKPTASIPSEKIPVGFKSNGKPDKIYHWNLPALKRVVASKQKMHRINDLDHFDDVMSHPENWNEVFDKSMMMNQNHNHNRKPLKPTFYVPQKPKKSNFMKYFPGNGKPHLLYVIEKNKRAQYHRL